MNVRRHHGPRRSFANLYQIQEMLGAVVLGTIADQIVSGIVETLRDRQTNMDTNTRNGGLPLW